MDRDRSPVEDKSPSDADADDRDDAARSAQSGRRQDRALAHGRDRRHARRADRRAQAREHRHDVPTTSETIDRPPREHGPFFGRSSPNALKSSSSPFASSEADEEPDHRGEHADDERLQDHRPRTCLRVAPIVRSVANSRVAARS